MLDFVSARSTERCSSRAQVAGIDYTMVCNPENPERRMCRSTDCRSIQ